MRQEWSGSRAWERKTHKVNRGKKRRWRKVGEGQGRCLGDLLAQDADLAGAGGEGSMSHGWPPCR